VEVSPVRLLRVEAEWILAFLGQSGIVAPQVPGLELCSLRSAKNPLDSLVPSTRLPSVSWRAPAVTTDDSL